MSLQGGHDDGSATAGAPPDSAVQVPARQAFWAMRVIQSSYFEELGILI